MNEDKLLSCPFCGSDPIVKRIGNEHTRKRKINIKCSNPYCRCEMTKGAIRYGFEWLMDVCLKAWNNRSVGKGE